jgi:hypothetical protein
VGGDVAKLAAAAPETVPSVETGGAALGTTAGADREASAAVVELDPVAAATAVAELVTVGSLGFTSTAAGTSVARTGLGAAPQPASIAAPALNVAKVSKRLFIDGSLLGILGFWWQFAPAGEAGVLTRVRHGSCRWRVESNSWRLGGHRLTHHLLGASKSYGQCIPAFLTLVSLRRGARGGTDAAFVPQRALQATRASSGCSAGRIDAQRLPILVFRPRVRIARG